MPTPLEDLITLLDLVDHPDWAIDHDDGYETNFMYAHALYLLFFVSMIVFFAYFYTFNVAFKVEDVADNLKNQNGFIPGIRPGKKTEEYLEYVVNRVLVLGSGYLALICLLPEILRDTFWLEDFGGGEEIPITEKVRRKASPQHEASAPHRRQACGING